MKTAEAPDCMGRIKKRRLVQAPHPPKGSSAAPMGPTSGLVGGIVPKGSPLIIGLDHVCEFLMARNVLDLNTAGDGSLQNTPKLTPEVRVAVLCGGAEVLQ